MPTKILHVILQQSNFCIYNYMNELHSTLTIWTLALIWWQRIRIKNNNVGSRRGLCYSRFNSQFAWYSIAFGRACWITSYYYIRMLNTNLMLFVVIWICELSFHWSYYNFQIAVCTLQISFSKKKIDFVYSFVTSLLFAWYALYKNSIRRSECHMQRRDAAIFGETRHSCIVGVEHNFSQ